MRHQAGWSYFSHIVEGSLALMFTKDLGVYGSYLLTRGVRIFALARGGKTRHLSKPEHQARLVYFSEPFSYNRVGERQIERKRNLSCSSSMMTIACGQACVAWTTCVLPVDSPLRRICSS